MIKDVRKPFYYIVGWSDEEQYYIGSRYARNCCTSDLGTTYFTSSKIVQAKWKQKSPDVIRVLMTFDTAAQAIEWEATALENLGVPKCRYFLNRSVGGKKFYVEDTPEGKAKRSEAQKEAQNRPEVRAKKSAAQNRPEVRAKKSATAKAAASRPDVKAKRSATNSRLDVKAKRSEAAKKVQNRPEVKAKRSATNSRPEIKERRSTSAKEALARPEVKLKLSAANKEAQNRPEVRAKHCKRMQTPDGVFDSLKDATQHYGVTSAALSYRMKRYPSAYYYI